MSDAVLGVVDDVGELVGMQAQVERVQHGAHQRDGEVAPRGARGGSTPSVATRSPGRMPSVEPAPASGAARGRRSPRRCRGAGCGPGGARRFRARAEQRLGAPEDRRVSVSGKSIIRPFMGRILPLGGWRASRTALPEPHPHDRLSLLGWRIAPRSGTCAMSACEPRQGRKAAALSRSCHVPQAIRTAVQSAIRQSAIRNLQSAISMSYQVIARKWRPQRFDDVVGQQAVTRTLRNALASGRLAQAFVFAGPRGVGKTTTARILARALNCVKGPTPDPCGACDACVEIAEGRDIDVLEIDAATHTGVDNVREVIIAGLSIVPVRNRYKVFIIDEVHQLSTAVVQRAAQVDRGAAAARRLHDGDDRARQDSGDRAVARRRCTSSGRSARKRDRRRSSARSSTPRRSRWPRSRCSSSRATPKAACATRRASSTR